MLANYCFRYTCIPTIALRLCKGSICCSGVQAGFIQDLALLGHLAWRSGMPPLSRNLCLFLPPPRVQALFQGFCLTLGYSWWVASSTRSALPSSGNPLEDNLFAQQHTSAASSTYGVEGYRYWNACSIIPYTHFHTMVSDHIKDSTWNFTSWHW